MKKTLVFGGLAALALACSLAAAPGNVVWLAMDDVGAITEFSNVEEYEKIPDDAARPGAKKPRD